MKKVNKTILSHIYQRITVHGKEYLHIKQYYFISELQRELNCTLLVDAINLKYKQSCTT